MRTLFRPILCTAFVASVLLGIHACAPARAEEIIFPQWEVPEYVSYLLEVAGNEVGYREGDHGYSKYGDWSGDAYAQWCAEYLCWCVARTDECYGTKLLDSVYPLYSGSNTGRSWFIRAGRYIVRNGYLEDWGYQWLKGETEFLKTGDYIPQPGDWVFFTWTNTQDTDHVAMVEYCTRDAEGNVTIHVLEGNNPVSVQRNTYALTNTRILGYGTVHDVADWTMRYGNGGEKVRQLQEQLQYLGYLDTEDVDGAFGTRTSAAVKAYQAAISRRQTGIADIRTQLALQADVEEAIDQDPNTWLVADED